jgi:predicted O-methyltransferase YrrM
VLYGNIIRQFRYERILELGTSIGINTLYLSKASDKVQVTTFEGCPETVNVAQELFNTWNAMNIKIIVGNIDQMLPQYLSKSEVVDFALLDANHRYEPTLRYFECLIRNVHDDSIVVLDDIHYSPEMEQAWIAIQNHTRVHATADLYRCGLVFFNPSLNKQNVVLQF